MTGEQNKDIFVHTSHTEMKEEQGDVVLNQELALRILEGGETKSHFKKKKKISKILCS